MTGSQNVRRAEASSSPRMCRSHRSIKAGADVIAPTGRLLTEASIGMALATRNLMEELRSAGETTGGPKPFQARDRSNFLSALDLVIGRLKREGYGV